MDLQQNTPEWHEFRKSGIGASEASICLQINPWRSRQSLWLEKCGLSQPAPSNAAMKRGLEMEGPALEWAEKELGISFRPTVKKSRLVPYMFASIDGISHDGLAIEIKNPMRGLHDTIPDYYYSQLQHQLFCIESKHMLYMSFDGVQGKIIEVKRDEDYIEKLLEAEKQFWYHVQNFIEPELSERDYVKRSDPEYMEKLAICLSNKRKAEEWKELYERSKTELTAITAENTICMGCKISKRGRQGNVQYKELTKDLNIDAEIINKYRSSPSSFWEIREGK